DVLRRDADAVLPRHGTAEAHGLGVDLGRRLLEERPFDRVLPFAPEVDVEIAVRRVPERDGLQSRRARDAADRRDERNELGARYGEVELGRDAQLVDRL